MSVGVDKLRENCYNTVCVFRNIYMEEGENF